jgi:hypothetical protein
MQVYANSERLSLKTIFFLIAILFFAFLPISSFLFFIKNDAFSGYFPPKFFMSESLHAGYLPLWNPYLNFGIPQYGDMSGGYWSPITWLIASTVGYNAYTLTLEVLFYILLGGIGMYQLTGKWKLENNVRIIAATAFMCCGYNVGHLQHFNWLSGAAFLPWCLWSYLLLLEIFSIKNTIRAVLLFYLLISSAHPGITISAFYFFFGVLIFFILKNEMHLPLKDRFKQLSISHFIFLLLLALLSAGMIAGYLDILPFFVRGEKISLSDSLSNPTNFQSWISILLPFATVKNNEFYNTDPSMRNSYFSLTLLLFFMLAFVTKKYGWQKFLLLIGGLFTLLSTGGIFKTIAFKFIPFIGYIRLNGEFRIFGLLCFIIIGAITLNKFIEQKNSFNGPIKWIYYLVETALIASIFFGLYKGINSKQSLLFNISNITVQSGVAEKLKALIDAVTFYDTFFIQGLIQLFILWGIKWSIQFNRWNVLKNIVIADMILACLLNIPFTGAGKASVAQVQSVINRSPKGIPVPVLQPIKNIDNLSSKEKEMVGDWSLYNKQIGVTNQVPYPIVLKNMNEYFENSEHFPSDNFLNKPFIFIVEQSGTNSLKIQSFNPNKITLTIEIDTLTNIVLQQNYYPHWFYQNGAVKKPVEKEGINFMRAPITKGENNISFSFEPAFVKWAMFLSCLLFLIYCLILFLPNAKPSSPS